MGRLVNYTPQAPSPLFSFYFVPFLSPLWSFFLLIFSSMLRFGSFQFPFNLWFDYFLSHFLLKWLPASSELLHLCFLFSLSPSFFIACNCFYFLIFITGFMILMYIFETYLDLRQHTALKLPTLPKTLEGVISQEKFEKSRAYSLDKRYIFLAILIYNLNRRKCAQLCFPNVSFFTFSHFHFIHEFVTILMDSAILFFRVLPWFWKVSNW